jgi:hypothetical protein
MAIPSNGITAEVIQELMPQFIIGDDLIGGILDAIPAPPAGASVAWRHARIARIIEETTALLPADAAQARHAAQIVSLRDVADDTMRCSHAVTATAMTVEQMCRVRWTAGKLICTAERLERALSRRQQLPTPVLGERGAACARCCGAGGEMVQGGVAPCDGGGWGRWRGGRGSLRWRCGRVRGGGGWGKGRGSRRGCRAAGGSSGAGFARHGGG